VYKALIRPLLFQFQAEKIHNFIFAFIKNLLRIPGLKSVCKRIYDFSDPCLEKEVFGIKFKNPVGLAAGFDKDAILIDELACFGFGFIEIGTLTPKGQAGNPKPRLFRLKKDAALINRMGFNNQGVDASLERIKRSGSEIIIGGNIGKNKDTPNEDAARDYEYCFEALFDHVHYFVVNVSSPNTPGLRSLQEKAPLRDLLNRLKVRNNAKSNPKPILLKIAPDLADSQLDDILDIIKETELDGIVATNTTVEREHLTTDSSIVEKIGSGGLSGKPLKERSTQMIRKIYAKTEGKLPIIAVGGIFTGQDAIDKLNAGASLVQIYSGFVYEGPGAAGKINRKIRDLYQGK